MNDTTSQSGTLKVIEQAEKLAQSGDFENWLGIEKHLVESGFSIARSILDDDDFWDRLDRICEGAIGRRRRQAQETGEPYMEPKTSIQYVDPTFRWKKKQN